jgi:hypothetical protein
MEEIQCREEISFSGHTSNNIIILSCKLYLIGGDITNRSSAAAIGHAKRGNPVGNRNVNV